MAVVMGFHDCGGIAVGFRIVTGCVRTWCGLFGWPMGSVILVVGLLVGW